MPEQLTAPSPIIAQDQHAAQNEHVSSHLTARQFLAVAALHAALAPTAFTGTAMVIEHEANPLTALNYVVNGEPLPPAPPAPVCPPAPRAADIKYIKDVVHTSFVVPSLPAMETVKNINSEILSANTFEEATTIASEYTKQAFGFDITLSVQDEQPGQLLSTDTYKRQLSLLTSLISILPAGLLNAANVSQIHITNLYDQTVKDYNGQPLGAAGTFGLPDQVVTLDLNAVGNPDIFIHEVLGHGVHHTVCQGAEYQDTTLTSLNPKDFEYVEDSSAALKSVARGVTSSGYGRANVLEDDAELTEAFAKGDTKTIAAIDRESSKGQKLGVILSRFEELDPGSVSHLQSIQPLIRSLHKKYEKVATCYFTPQK